MFVNILQLTFSIYMLQVYDKVLTSYNLSTLAVITLAAVICLVVLALLEWIRSRLLVRAGIAFDNMLSATVLSMNLKHAAAVPGGAGSRGNLRDVQQLRNFLGGNAVFAFFDLPWMPIYFALIFVLHPALGWVAVGGGIIVFILGVLTERLTRTRLENATRLNAMAAGFTGAALRNASIVRAMGMVGHVTARWRRLNDAVIGLQTRASHKAGLLRAVSKSLRTGLQVAIYAVGAYLTVMHESTAGVMIAASIVMGRALAPIDQAMATYKQSLDARSSYNHLKELLDTPPAPPSMDLPAPAGELTAENLFLTINGRPLVRGVSFRLPAGQSLAIIGPSAAGKSTLCKLLLSIWAPTAGKVRIDRADIHSWDSEKLGPYIGYLPQDVELFAGSVAENIARMGDVDSQKVIAAAQMAGVHSMVLGLPKGYDTQIGEHGAALSGGQRQRIGLARALYGDPRLVVLDEPNSNLDEEGEQQLARAVLNLKQRNATVVLVTHKPSILNIVDNIIVMQEGQIALSGPRQAVLEKLAAMRHQQEQAAQARVQQEKLAQQQALQKQQEVIRCKNDIRNAEVQLNRYLGFSPHERITYAGRLQDFHGVVSYTEEQAIKTALYSRPDLIVAQKSVAVAYKDTHIAMGEFAPRVDASYEDTRFSKDYNDRRYNDYTRSYWAIGLNFSWDIFSGGSAVFNTLAERNRARALQKDYEDAMAGARTDVIKAMLDMDAARELITTTRYGVDSARENYAMSQKRYMTNIGTITDLVDAQVRLTEAERDASRALADYHSARARFYFNIGQENPGLR